MVVRACIQPNLHENRSTLNPLYYWCHGQRKNILFETVKVIHFIPPRWVKQNSNQQKLLEGVIHRPTTKDFRRCPIVIRIALFRFKSVTNDSSRQSQLRLKAIRLPQQLLMRTLPWGSTEVANRQEFYFILVIFAISLFPFTIHRNPILIGIQSNVKIFQKKLTRTCIMVLRNYINPVNIFSLLLLTLNHCFIPFILGIILFVQKFYIQA